MSDAPVLSYPPIWYFPSYSGDFRLEAMADTPSLSVLTVVDPTPAELRRLRKFLGAARLKGWIDGVEGIGKTGTSVLNLAAPLVETGALLAGRALQVGEAPLLTAVRSAGGAVTCILKLGVPEPPAAPEPEAAVTTPAPRRGGQRTGDCPESLASEVLHAFSSPAQWASWQRTGTMVAAGHLTGHRYLLCHRRRLLEHGLAQVATDIDDAAGHRYGRRGLPVVAHDWLLPPPEEVLSIKLCIEHHEPYIRCRGTMNMGRQVFEGGEREDAQLSEDLRIVEGVGSIYLGAIGRTWTRERRSRRGAR